MVREDAGVGLRSMIASTQNERFSVRPSRPDKAAFFPGSSLMLTGGATIARNVARRPENRSMITSTASTVYPVSDMGRTRAFYEHVLGLHVRDHRHYDD